MAKKKKAKKKPAAKKKKKKKAKKKPAAKEKKKAKKKPAAKKKKKKAKQKKPAAKKKKAKQKKLLFVPDLKDQQRDQRELGPRVHAWQCAGRYPSRTAYAQDRLEPPLALVWRARIARGGSTPPVVSRDGVVYVADREGGLHALDAEEGEPLSSLHTDPILEGSPMWPLVSAGHVPGAKVPVSSAPALAGWNLLFGDDEGIFYCVRRGEGTVMWRKGIAQLSMGARSHGAYQAPLVAHDAVYTLDHDGNLYAADVRSGRSVFAPLYLRGRPATAPVLSGRRLVVAAQPIYSDAPQLHAIDPLDGRRCWRRELPGQPREALAASRDQVLVGGDFGLRSYHLWSGDPRWSLPTNVPVRGPICLDRARAYLAFGDKVGAVHLSDGGRAWLRGVGVKHPVSGLACAGGVVWAAAGRSLAAWEGDDGSVLGRVRLPGTAVGGPTVALGRIYVSTTAGEVACLAPE